MLTDSFLFDTIKEGSEQLERIKKPESNKICLSASKVPYGREELGRQPLSPSGALDPVVPSGGVPFSSVRKKSAGFMQQPPASTGDRQDDHLIRHNLGSPVRLEEVGTRLGKI